VATALGFPVVQRLVNRFVDAIVLRRPNYARLRATIADLISGLDSTDQILDAVCSRLASALHAREVGWKAVGAEGPAIPSPQPTRSEIVVPTHEPPRFALEVRELAPGKVLLSDDLVLLDAIALLVARRIDSVRLTHERCERDFREQEVVRLATEAELRALRAQLNPHFLFNALNTIGYLMRAAPERAFGTLLDLTRLLRAVLKRSGGDFATLGQELELVRAYLAIEAARFEDRLRVIIDVPRSLETWLVPPLVLQPLVENAIKHGITLRAEGGEVSIVARGHAADETLTIQVVDTGMGASEGRMQAGRREGVGLASIERRLAAYYGSRGSFEIASQPGLGTRATLRIPAAPASGRPAATIEEPAVVERAGFSA
jgi:signal transduction histidine kinase